MRDCIGCAPSTVIGAGNYADGSGQFETVVGISSMFGSAGGFSLSGSPTTGDVYTITLSSTATGFTGGGAANYTVLNTDTVATIATALASAVGATHPQWSQPVPVGAAATVTAVSLNERTDLQNNVWLYLHSPGTSTTGAKVSVAESCVGTCNITFTLLGAFSGADNVVVGAASMSGVLTTANQNTIVGDDVAGRASTTFNNNVMVGFSANKSASNDSGDVSVGAFAGWVSTGTSGQTLLGYKSGFALTSGSGNTFLGSNSASSATTGSNNLLMGVNGTCQLAAASTNNSIVICGDNGTEMTWTGTNTPSTSAATLSGSLTLPNVSTVGTIAGSVCMTSANLLLYESGATGCTISLETLKRDIASISPGAASEVLMKLRPIAYNMKENDTGRRYGFGAIQVHDVDPKLSTFDGNGALQAFDPNGILALAVAAIQRQQTEIDALKRRVK